MLMTKKLTCLPLLWVFDNVKQSASSIAKKTLSIFQLKSDCEGCVVLKRSETTKYCAYILRYILTKEREPMKTVR